MKHPIGRVAEARDRAFPRFGTHPQGSHLGKR